MLLAALGIDARGFLFYARSPVCEKNSLGLSVNRGTLTTPWGRGPSPARRGGLRDHPGQQLGMREHRVVAGR